MKAAEKFLLPSEAARILGISPQRVRELVDAGRLPAERTAGGNRLILHKAVEDLAEERAANGRARAAR